MVEAWVIAEQKIIVCTAENNIHEILSFDDYFDKVDGIVRIY
jgi:predicted nucleic acid-binding protein